jgi:branched-chain amino acid transport system substrate-binding protein
MRKLSSFMVITLLIITMVAVILGGCSTKTTVTTTATTTTTTTATATTTATSGPPPTTTTPTTTEPIKIGLIIAMSGPFGSLAAYEEPCVKMVVDATNAAGGLLGRQVQLIERDDNADPSLVGQKADELKAAGVVGIIGAAMDADNEALSVWAKINHIPIGNGTSADLTMRTTNYSGYNFFLTPPGWTYAKVLAEWAANQDNIKSVYAIATDMGANHAVLDAFWPFMNQLKPSVTNLGTIYTSMTEQDFSTAISSALAKKPDLLLDLCAGPSGAAWIKQAMQFNVFKNTTVAGPYILGADVTGAIGMDYPTGVQAIDNCPFWLDTPEMKAFLTEFNQRTKLYPGSLSMAFYLSTLSMIDAIKKAGSTDPDKITAAWQTLTVDTSPVGSFSFDDFDNQGEVPTWMNTSGFSPDFPVAIGLNPIKYQQGIYPTKDEIMALRAAK